MKALLSRHRNNLIEGKSAWLCEGFCLTYLLESSERVNQHVNKGNLVDIISFPKGSLPKTLG